MDGGCVMTDINSNKREYDVYGVLRMFTCYIILSFDFFDILVFNSLMCKVLVVASYSKLWDSCDY